MLQICNVNIYLITVDDENNANEGSAHLKETSQIFCYYFKIFNLHDWLMKQTNKQTKKTLLGTR